MFNIKSVAVDALSSALSRLEHCSPPTEEVIDKVRLAHSLLARGEPTAEELQPLLGQGWVIQGRSGRADINAVSRADYRAAQIRALAARLDLPESPSRGWAR